ncbi:hypothetical protein EAH79_11380 [Sphingomonas koreensis]|nr:hypothetical protein EAH79_11380 [Sphingomonas koreensis]
MDRATGDKIVGGAGGEAHMILGAEQDDVGQRRLHRVADAPRAIRSFAARRRQIDRRGRRRFVAGLAATPQIAQMRWVDRKIASERAAEHLIRGDQRAQPLVDLAVHPFAPLLDRHHHKQPHADADQREHRQADQCRQQAVP